jgi:putative ABC transport system ATP-binding protein
MAYDSSAPAATDVVITLRDVSKWYRSGREQVGAVQHVSLDVRRGELLAIVGPSGSGKTTLTHIIGGLIKPSQGSVLVHGKRLDEQSDRKLSHYRNQGVGFIFQNFSLLPHYSALENVAVPMVLARIRPRKRKAIAQQILRMVGLEKQANQRTAELSGGQRQRVAIARALAMRPELLIADEPTGSLDSARGDEIMCILEHLAHDQHITVLMVTHDLDLAARADRIVHIHDGKITEDK